MVFDGNSTDHIQTREDFEREVRALAARALKQGGYVPLVEIPITSVDQITDGLLDQLAGAGPVNPDDVKKWSIGRDTGRPPRFLTEECLQRWRKEPVPDPSERRKELVYRRDQLRETLTELVRRERDVSTIINTLGPARWDYLLLVAHRGHPDRPLRTDRRHPRTRLQVKAERALKAAMEVLQGPRPTPKTEQALMAAMNAMQALLLFHVDADRLVQPLRGPGTLEEFLSGETTYLYPESEPARRYLAGMHAAQDVRHALRTSSPPQLGVALHALQDAQRALRTDARLRPPARPGRPSSRAAHHQLFLRALRTKLHGLGVSHAGITILLRASGLLTLTRTDRHRTSK
jgi:hypothetical protein